MEIRVYFECLEQAMAFVVPGVKKGLAITNKNIPIKLIRRPTNIPLSFKNCIGAIYSLTTPDFLITVVINDKEIPLVIGEFSEAVLTEDHELQRAIGAISAAMVGGIYLKIAGEKTSDRAHGGLTDFNPLSVAKILKERLGYKGFIMGRWPSIKDNPTILVRDKINLSCPPVNVISIAENILTYTGVIIGEHGNKIKSPSAFTSIMLSKLAEDNNYCEYEKNVDSALGLENLLKEWQRRAIRRHPRIYVSDQSITIKLNRFSHAADPDRGIITFISLIGGYTKTYFRYCIKKSADSDINKLIRYFVKQATEEGLDRNLIKAITNINKKCNKTYDVTIKIKNKLSSINMNKVARCILELCDGFILHDYEDTIEAEIKWNRNSLFSIESNSNYDFIKETRGFEIIGEPLNIAPIKDYDINEDEVTFVVVHSVLQPNEFRVISVSYPGAQGDAAILPERAKGRAQSRMYIDVIAWLPQKCGGPDIALEESKCIFNKREIEAAIRKMNEIRDVKSKKEALIETVHNLGELMEPKRIFIGIAFGVNNRITTWKPYNVDFIIRIINREKWEIAHFGSALDDALKIREGKTGIPQIYEVITN
jgi:hypothetical protein